MNREKVTGIFLFGLGLAVFLKSLTYPLGTLRKLGGVARYMGPRELPAFYEQEDRKLKRLIDYSGFKPID